MRYPLTRSLFLFLAAFGVCHAQSTTYSIQPIGGQVTSEGALGINDRGQILYSGAAGGGTFHNDLFSLQTGTYVSFQIAGASFSSAFAFNNLDQFVAESQHELGDLLIQNGMDGTPTAIPIDETVGVQVNPVGINDAGTILASTVNAYTGERHAIVYQNGTVKRIDFPAAAQNSTFPEAINDAGTVVGTYSDNLGVFHGMVYQNGRFQTFDVPQTKSTSISGINNSGQMAGSYVGLLGVSRSWAYVNGKFITLPEPAGSTYSEVDGINDEGQILSRYFIWNPSNFTGF